PRVGPERGGEPRTSVAEHGGAVGDEHPLRLEVEERLQRRDEALAVPARTLLAVEVTFPDPQPTAGLDHRVPEGERSVRGDPERLLLPARAADRVGTDAGG